jgi:hypothetical protein
VGEPADVVEVEGVGGVVRAGDVGVGQVGRLLQVEAWVGVGQPGRQATARHGQVELGRTQLEVAAPLGLGVEAERQVGGQIPAGGGVGEVEDVLAGEQAAVGEGRVAGLVNLEAQAERGGVAAGQVGADR